MFSTNHSVLVTVNLLNSKNISDNCNFLNMPVFCFETNLPKGRITKDIILSATELISKVLNKPAEKCIVTFKTDQIMCFGGLYDYCGVGYLRSIGGLGPKENQEISKALFDYIEEKLHVFPSRVYIHFLDVAASDLGNNGTTVQALMDQAKK